MLTFRDHNDALAAHTNWRRHISTYFEGTARGWLHDREERYGRDAMVPSAVGFRHMREDTVTADVCWMSHEMMDLVQRAMGDFDRSEPVAVEDCFIPHGFLVLPEPFMSRDINGKLMAQRAVMWRLDEWGCVFVDESDEGFSYTFDKGAEGRVVPTLRITTLSHVNDPDDYTADEPGLYEMMLERGMEWGIIHTTTIPLPLISTAKEVRGEGDADAGWLTFWRVTQKLMSERIVLSERRKAARPARREAQRFGFDAQAPRVIELRRPRTHEADPDGERSRDVKWTHRWIVGGHWRQQWYPSIGGHRQRWIGAYEKGPENLPLVIRERVWNWDR